MNNPFYLRKENQSKRAETLANKVNCSTELAKLLLSRGQDENSALDFLFPSLKNLTPARDYGGMTEAANRIFKAIAGGERIVIYGDYDVDGICACAILYLCITNLGGNAMYFVPDRAEDGYGLSESALSFIAEEMFPDLIITVDCGVTAIEEVNFVHEVLGSDIIVTDHHECFETLPDCIVVDPKADKKGFYEICGAGVALRLAEVLEGESAFENYLEIACLATIADSVPLEKDNRIIAALGLKNLQKTKIKGLKKLLQSIDLKAPPTSYDVAFKIAPRLNAPGRLGSASEVVSLFYEEDDFLLDGLIEKITALNAERQGLCEKLVTDCLESLKDTEVSQKSVLILKGEEWDGGVLGIVCSRLTEVFNKPVLLLTKNGETYRGSGRSAGGVNLFDALRANDKHLPRYGGHAAACGLTVAAEGFAEFKEGMEEFCKNRYAEIDFLPSKPCDIWSTSPPSLDFVREIESLKPFGAGNPAVSFVLETEELNFAPIGTSAHIKCAYKDAELLWFYGNTQLGALKMPAKKILPVRFSLSEYQNRLYVQGILNSIFLDFDSFAENGKITGEPFDENYIKQLFKKKEGISAPKEITEGELEKILAKSLFGTVAVAFRLETLKNFGRYIKSNGLEEKFTYFNIGGADLNPVNRIILSPDLKTDLSFYDNVIFLDKPLSAEYLDLMAFSRTAKMFLFEKTAAKLEINMFNREKLGVIYKQIKQNAGGKQFSAFAEIFKGENFAEGFAAFCVLFDLGIITKSGGGFKFCPGTGKPFHQSNFYTRLVGAVSDRPQPKI